MTISIRPAATLILVRDAAAGMEVLMLRRSDAAVFLPGAYVFPGGALEPGDDDPAVLDRVVGLAESEANRLLGLSEGALAYWVAAIRECFEESGVLLALDRYRRTVTPANVVSFAKLRIAMNHHEVSFSECLAQQRLTLPAGDLAYFDHWITPPERTRRFDTRFFMACAPAGQEGSHEDAETVHSVWLRPGDALKRAAGNEMQMPAATFATLEELAH